MGMRMEMNGMRCVCVCVCWIERQRDMVGSQSKIRIGNFKTPLTKQPLHDKCETPNSSLLGKHCICCVFEFKFKFKIHQHNQGRPSFFNLSNQETHPIANDLRFLPFHSPEPPPPTPSPPSTPNWLSPESP
mmetsp:Transcript_31425/g.65719  ORF Transcript_31425/g.65719 Transcript_31425/m.65719 type:complete len:131 (-) Transcript_31425:711-1103(-)